MITEADSYTTYDIGKYFLILPDNEKSTLNSFKRRLKVFKKIPNNFNLRSLIKSIKKNSKVNAEAYKNDEQLLKLIKSSNDKLTFLFLGAGTVTQWLSLIHI